MTHRLLSIASRTSLALWSAGFIVSLSACNTGQIGGEIDVDDDEGQELASDQCEDNESTAIEAEEETSVGITAQEFADAIAGDHELGFEWLEVGRVSVTPEPGEGTITIEVRPKIETAKFVDREKRQNDDGDEDGNDLIQPAPEPDIGGGGFESCPDRLSIEAEVTVTSDNGALADTFDATFFTSDGLTMSAVIDVEPGSLEGSFQVQAGADSIEVVQTTLSLNFAYGSLSGELSGLVQETSGQGDSAAVSASPTVFGRFPLGGCEFGAIVSDGELVDELLRLVQTHVEFNFDWQSGESTTLTLDPRLDDAICAEGSTLTTTASVQAQTADGRIDGFWQLIVEGNLVAGELDSVTVRYPGRHEPVAAGDFERETGISGVDSEASDLSFQFDYSLEPNADPAYFGGSFAVLELNVPDCVRPGYEPPAPMEEPDGGSSSPGCEGIDTLGELSQASFLATSGD